MKINNNKFINTFREKQKKLWDFLSDGYAFLNLYNFLTNKRKCVIYLDKANTSPRAIVFLRKNGWVKLDETEIIDNSETLKFAKIIKGAKNKSFALLLLKQLEENFAENFARLSIKKVDLSLIKYEKITFTQNHFTIRSKSEFTKSFHNTDLEIKANKKPELIQTSINRYKKITKYKNPLTHVFKILSISANIYLLFLTLFKINGFMIRFAICFLIIIRILLLCFLFLPKKCIKKLNIPSLFPALEAKIFILIIVFVIFNNTSLELQNKNFLPHENPGLYLYTYFFIAVVLTGIFSKIPKKLKLIIFILGELISTVVIVLIMNITYFNIITIVISFSIIIPFIWINFKVQKIFTFYKRNQNILLPILIGGGSGILFLITVTIIPFTIYLDQKFPSEVLHTPILDRIIINIYGISNMSLHNIIVVAIPIIIYFACKKFILLVPIEIKGFFLFYISPLIFLPLIFISAKAESKIFDNHLQGDNYITKSYCVKIHNEWEQVWRIGNGDKALIAKRSISSENPDSKNLDETLDNQNLRVYYFTANNQSNYYQTPYNQECIPQSQKQAAKKTK